MRDIDRDNFLGPDEAVEYGLADTVLSAREPCRRIASAESAAPGDAVAERLVDRGAAVGVELDARRLRRCRRTCSGRDAPMIAEATLGSRSTHASASCAIVEARARRRSGAAAARASSSGVAHRARSMKTFMRRSSRRAVRRAAAPRACTCR